AARATSRDEPPAPSTMCNVRKQADLTPRHAGARVPADRPAGQQTDTIAHFYISLYCREMALSSATVLAALRAIGEDTRLRLMALLRHGELTVTDLTEICGQSQPRISRHLKLLNEAGLVDRHREGAWVYFALVADGPLRELADHALGTIDELDPVLAGDL